MPKGLRKDGSFYLRSVGKSTKLASCGKTSHQRKLQCYFQMCVRFQEIHTRHFVSSQWHSPYEPCESRAEFDNH